RLQAEWRHDSRCILPRWSGERLEYSLGTEIIHTPMLLTPDQRGRVPRLPLFLILATLTACGGVETASPSKEAVEAALGLECLPAAISRVRVNAPGVLTTGDLLRFDLRPAYEGRNPPASGSGTGPKGVADSSKREIAEGGSVTVWPLDVRLAVHKGTVTTVDTNTFRCYAVQDHSGELRVVEQRPARAGSKLRQLSGRLKALFK
ncbi:MAG: hypothetical protein ABI877_09390, partial [Gemmatimonadaceae bacterium]